MSKVPLQSMIHPLSKGCMHYARENDCTVRAFANVVRCPYVEAERLMHAWGRKDNAPMALSDYAYALLNEGFNGVALGNSPESIMLHFDTNLPIISACKTTVKEWMETHPEGQFIVVIKQHVFAMIDGEIIDAIPVAENERIHAVFTLAN